MKTLSPDRKAVALLAAVVLVCLSLWIARGATIISGTKSTPTFAETRTPHGGSGTTTVTATEKTTTPAAQP